MPSYFMVNTLFDLNYELSYIVIFTLVLATLTLYFRYISDRLNEGTAAIHKTTLIKYYLIFFGFAICIGILVYGTFFKKLENANQVDCVLVNLIFFILLLLIALFIIQAFQDIAKTYRDKKDYQEEEEIARYSLINLVLLNEGEGTSNPIVGQKQKK